MQADWWLSPFLHSTPGPAVVNTVLTVTQKGRGGAWVAQSVNCPIIDFSSCHDLAVVGSSPMPGSALSVEPAWAGFLFFSLSLCPSPTCVLSFKLHELKKKMIQKTSDFCPWEKSHQKNLPLPQNIWQRSLTVISNHNSSRSL